jgi:hypothetical protein
MGCARVENGGMVGVTMQHRTEGREVKVGRKVRAEAVSNGK